MPGTLPAGAGSSSFLESVLRNTVLPLPRHAGPAGHTTQGLVAQSLLKPAFISGAIGAGLDISEALLPGRFKVLGFDSPPDRLNDAVSLLANVVLPYANHSPPKGL